MRWVLGADLGEIQPDVAVAAVVSEAGALADPEITLKSIDGRAITFTIEAYVVGAKSHLMEIRVYVIPEGTPDVPVTGAGFAASTLPYGFEDASRVLAGDVVVTRPATAVKAVGRAIYGFES